MPRGPSTRPSVTPWHPALLPLPGALGREASMLVKLEAVERTDAEDVPSG